MATGDKDFAGQLKISWDTQLIKHPRLIVILCGSVSSWIDENILNNTGFAGRVSLELTIQDLSLFHCNQFWREKKDSVSSSEKLKMLSISGGVPRYLEEIRPEEPVENIVKRLCFSKEGFLYSEFDQMFSDFFSKKASNYKKILETLANGSKSLSGIADAISQERSGYLTRCLKDLELSGFIRCEPVYKIGSKKQSRLHNYRIKDYYIRFYLKYIEPIKTNIRRGIYEDISLDKIIDWEIIIGFQFECLVLNNINTVLKILQINDKSILSASPYFQRKTLRQEACQIDLLIQATNTLYICEIKCRKKISATVIQEVREKVRKLKPPQDFSVRTVLIYEGSLAEKIISEQYFDSTICFNELLNFNNPST